MTLISFRFSSPTKAKQSDSPYSIIADFTFGKRIRVNTNIKIKFKHFNPDYNGNMNKIVKSSIIQEGLDRTSMIDEFKKAQNRILEAIDLYTEGRLPDYNNAQEAIEKFLITGRIQKNNLIEKIEEYVRFKAKSNLESRTLYTHNKVQEIIHSIVRDNPRKKFDAFNLDENFFYAYLNYAKEQDYISTTYNKYLNGIKSFLNWLQKRYPNLKVNMYYKNVQALEEPDNINFLTAAEVQEFVNYEFTLEGHKREKDMFIFQMCTGRRDSDIQPLRKSLVTWMKDSRMLMVNNIKGKKAFTVPLPNEGIAILEKYEDDGKLPLISNQKRNEHLKAMFKLMGNNRIILINKFSVKENKILQTEYKLCDLVSTHWARSSFITYLTINGVSNAVIGQITGQTHRTIARYQGRDLDALDLLNREKVSKLFNK